MDDSGLGALEVGGDEPARTAPSGRLGLQQAMIETDLDAGVGQHLLEDGAGHARLVVGAEHGVDHLLGVGTMRGGVVALHAAHELAKGSAQRLE